MQSSSTTLQRRSLAVWGGLLEALCFCRPLVLLGAYVWLMRVWYLQFESSRLIGENPYVHCWWSGPIVSSCFYIIFTQSASWMTNYFVPLTLKQDMIVYNLYQVVLNIWCSYCLIRDAIFGDMKFWGNPIDSSSKGLVISYYIWIHYNNKYVELFDTIFMFLRHKNKQISFLHVYHHILMIWAWFVVVKTYCGGDAYFGAFVNSVVHIVMYSYYFMALLKIPCPWKPYLTMIQMGQFCLCISHSIYGIIFSTTPNYLNLVQMWVMVSLLVLFLNFYRKTYGKKKQG